MKKVSQLLKEKRIEKGLSIEDVEKEIKIKKVFLEFIEDGKFHDLPSESYALGFVKNYASFLGLPLNTISPLFRREYESDSISVVPEFRRTQHKFNKSIFTNPKIFFALFIVFVISLYIFFQYSSLIFSPKLIVVTPKENLISDKNVVEVTGKTDQYNTVFVNGDEAYTTLQGTFKKSVYLFSGEQKISVVAKNRVGKETKKTINVTIR